MTDRPSPLPLDWSCATGRILPRLRSGGWAQLALLEAQSGHAPRCCQQRIAPGLYLTLVLDDDDTMTTVTELDLEHWGVSFEQASSQACRNLGKRSDEGWIELTEGLWLAPWDEASAASRLLLQPPTALTPVEQGARSEALLVAVPNRDTLLLADEREPGALEAMMAALERLEGHDYPISAALYRWQPELSSRPSRRLSVHALCADHAAAVAHHNLQVRAQMRAYADEQWPRQRALGSEPYVATAEAEAGPDGALVSRALWTEGVATLLPAVDRIQLLPASRDGVTSRLWVTRLDALAELPGVLTACGGALPRFKTHRFPSTLEIRRIGTAVERDPATADLDAGAG